MGAWGYFDDENDSCADEWENLLDRFITTIPSKMQKKINTSTKLIKYIRSHSKTWYNVLITHIVALIESQSWGYTTDRVAVGLMIQTVRTLTSKLSDVENNATGFQSRLIHIQKSVGTEDQDEFVLPALPSDFPPKLCMFGRAICNRWIVRSSNEDPELLEILRIQKSMFACI